ncbi:MAG: AAA family ATPase [bacterium]|nr:AAA family ATPase [bacterium]
MFIALEGADGCGKTTLCAVLTERMGATAYATPPKKYLQMRERVDKNASSEEHYRFYRDGIYDASDEIGVMLKSDGKVVSDRYWLTTYTYHQVMGVSVHKNDFASIIQPDLTVILALNHDVQMERMLHRGMSVGDRRVLDKQREIAKAFYQVVLELSTPFVVIDTQCFSPNRCADIVVAALGS